MSFVMFRYSLAYCIQDMEGNGNFSMKEENVGMEWKTIFHRPTRFRVWYLQKNCRLQIVISNILTEVSKVYSIICPQIAVLSIIHCANSVHIASFAALMLCSVTLADGFKGFILFFFIQD